MSRSKFKITKAMSGRFHWRLVSPNGKIVCSGQSRGYLTKQACKKGINAVRRTAPLGKVVDRS